VILDPNVLNEYSFDFEISEDEETVVGTSNLRGDTLSIFTKFIENGVETTNCLTTLLRI